jgi:hypothetical protein
MINWVDKPGIEEGVFGLLSDITVRHKFEDCVDIPPNYQYTVPFEMPPKVARVFSEMRAHSVALLNNHHAITAVNAAVAVGKLIQIASGAVYDSDGRYNVIDTSRYELIMDLVEQAKHSLVFFLWEHQRDLLIAEAEKRGLTYAVLDGNVKDKEREAVVAGFQKGFYRVIFAHPKSAAHGLTLTKGTRTIWSSPTPDLELFIQGNKRQHRIGQTEKTETIVVLGDNPVEQRVYHEILVPKKHRMDTLLSLFADNTADATA